MGCGLTPWLIGLKGICTADKSPMRDEALRRTLVACVYRAWGTSGAQQREICSEAKLGVSPA